MTDTNPAYDDRSTASGVQRDTTLSTADVANATATPVREEEATQAGDTSGAELSDRPMDAPVPRNPAAPDASRASSAAANAAASGDGQAAPLFPTDQATSLRDRWTDVQASFVDEPRQAVEQADGLVAEVIQKLAQSFADERSKLEHQWDRGEDVNTEDLRVALRRYRSFFDRLLSL